MTDSQAGAAMYALAADLFPHCRSITGEGLRETLRRIQREIPLELTEVPSGTQVLDWTVPREWRIRDAYIKNSRGERVVDFRRHNLHVMSYSTPVRASMTLAELRPHLFSLPEHPEWIPYRTSYYAESWGFCLPHGVLAQLPEDVYEVCIDSTLVPGSLTYGEYVVRGESSEEVLISCHSCHPSLANDNLSGIAVGVELAKHLSRWPRRLSYRFLFLPGTIGSITWLAQNAATVDRVRHGLVLSCLGDGGGFTYKRSRRGRALIDRAAEHVLKHANAKAPTRILDFVPYGYDERQYCSPGFDLPVGCLMRSQNGTFPEYHTSADDLNFISPAALAESYRVCLSICDVLEENGTFVNVKPHGEPQLGRRGLYRSTGGHSLPGYELALLWALNFSDGEHTLLDIAERSGLAFGVIRRAVNDLMEHCLIVPASTSAFAEVNA